METLHDETGVTFRSLRYLIASDLYRYGGKLGARNFVAHLLLGRGSKFMIWWRATQYLAGKTVLWFPFFVLSRVVTRRLGVKHGILLPRQTRVGPGFCVRHAHGTIVNEHAVIGRNCTISQQVTIGATNRGRAGVPTIGDNVFIGPGARILGAVVIGRNVTIGANAVVTRNVEADAVVLAAQPDILRTNDASFPVYGSAGYVTWTDYDDKLGS